MPRVMTKNGAKEIKQGDVPYRVDVLVREVGGPGERVDVAPISLVEALEPPLHDVVGRVVKELACARV